MRQVFCICYVVVSFCVSDLVRFSISKMTERCFEAIRALDAAAALFEHAGSIRPSEPLSQPA